MDKYFSIGEVSKITGLSIDRLRNYDKIGLLKPSYIDPKSGYRYYSENKFRKLRIITYLRKIGTPLKEIDLILNKNIDSQEFAKFLELKIRDIEKEIESLNVSGTKITKNIAQKDSIWYYIYKSMVCRP